MLLMLDTRSKYHQFYSMDANILSYKNISSVAPPRPTGTLTHSLQKRFKELFANSEEEYENDDFSLSYFGHKIDIRNLSSQYMASNINHLSKIFTVPKQQSTSILSLSNEWTYSFTQSHMNLFIFEEQKYNSSKKEVTKAAWRNCFNDYINGSFESTDYNEYQDLFAGSFYLPLTKERILRLYDNKKCYGVQESEQLYEDLTINSLSQTLNIAVTEDIVAYTLDKHDHKIYWAYRDKNQKWVHQEIEYTRDLQKFRMAQNMGLKFVGQNSKNETQLLVVDLVESNSALYLKYYLFKFLQGESLIQQEDSIQQSYLKNTTVAEIVSDQVYVSRLNVLFSVGVEGELNSIDVFNLQNLAPSVIKYNPRTKQILVMNFHKTLLLICTKEEDTFVAYQIKDFEDQAFKIKTFDSSPNGLFYAFLVQQNNKLRVFVLHNEYLKDLAVNKLHLVNFDYTLKSEEKSIVDVKLVRGSENEINLMVILESGDIATYSLHMGSSKLNRNLLNHIIDDEFDFLSLGILSAAIFMLMTLKFARSIRININIRRQM